MSKPIVVTGATGTVGSRVAEQLAAAGASVRAAVRDPGKVAPREGVETVAVDLAAPESVAPAISGASSITRDDDAAKTEDFVAGCSASDNNAL